MICDAAVSSVTLDEIASRETATPALRVPSWSLGTVRRRSITFANGHCDDRTFVIWVQAHGMTGDLRIHPARPVFTRSDRLEDLDLETLSRLASVEGGIATTSWSDGVMSWSDWIGFQPYDKYPEPGLMQRVGDCMMEFAPSGIYVEDWRFQPSSPGLLAGLRLISDVDTSGVERPRQGGLVIAGDHAISSIARRQELAQGTRAQDFVRLSVDPVAALKRIFDCSVDYAVRSQGSYRIAQSTDPRREGRLVELATGFSMTELPGVVRQRVSDDPEIRSRLWRIDSLAADVEFPLTTTVAPERLAWLEAEADTLIEPSQSSGCGAQRCA
jgi:hypothetical protein